MKSLSFFVLLFSIATSTEAQSNFFVELLAGQSERVSETVDDPALAIRGGYSFAENFSLELAYWDYGENSQRAELGFYFRPPLVVDIPPDGLVGVEIDPEIEFGSAFIIDPDADRIDTRDRISAWNIGLAWTYPLGDQWSVLSRIGVSRADVEIESTIIGYPTVDATEPEVLGQFSIDDQGTNVYLGLGLRYSLSDRLFLGAEYEMNDVELEGGTIDTDTASLSLGVRL